MPNWWITNLREFLNKIGSTIHLQEPWFIPPLRQHNHHLMEDFLDAGYSTNNLQTLKNCWIHLQITTLTKITDHTGSWLLPKACLQGSKTPSLQSTSKSSLIWPTQPSPAKLTWALWTWAIQKLYTKPGLPNLLNHLLGPWIPTVTQIQTWNY